MSKSLSMLVVVIAGMTASSSAFAQVTIVNNGPYRGAGPQVIVDQSINIVDNSKTIYDESTNIIDNREIYAGSRGLPRRHYNPR